MPCHAHAVAGGAGCASEHGGGGACARGACPSWQPEVGRGRWAPRGGCEAPGSPPSKPPPQQKEEVKGEEENQDSFCFRH